ncbi:hypothetical protein PQC38_gp120 [Aeromonas phage BUCT695]|uniref:hypothetical protein n=1 Tax=Aeromonas phage BUCT695 TaxID=2908630 RepID=UPI0023297BA3|nr:hypothetical protein PQC38_gp120 [Aeromonas phage BUCT695]UIW10596.1 hypothetical protein [Aeromonas phage BUCT695]
MYNFKLNYPIQTEEAKKFWGSRHKCNRAKAIIAFSLNEENAFDNLRRHGYYHLWRHRAWDAFGMYVNKPDMEGIPFSEMETPYWECMPFEVVKPPVNPTFTKQPVDISGTETDKVIFSAEGKDYTEVKWQMSGPGSDTFNDLPNSNNINFEFTLLFAANGSKYRCGLKNTNEVGSTDWVYSNPANIEVKQKPPIPPQVLIQPKDLSGSENSVVVFDCTAMGYQKYMWKVQMKEESGDTWHDYQGGDFPTDVKRDFTLIKSADGMKYKCTFTITNTAGSSSVDTEVHTISVASEPEGITIITPKDGGVFKSGNDHIGSFKVPSNMGTPINVIPYYYDPEKPDDRKNCQVNESLVDNGDGTWGYKFNDGWWAIQGKPVKYYLSVYFGTEVASSPSNEITITWSNSGE